MPREVTVSPAAGQGMRDARRRFAHPGAGPVAKASWRRLLGIRKRIQAAPCTYLPSPAHPGCRHMICEGYFILYEVVPDTGDNATAGDVQILAVFPPGTGKRERP